MSEPQSLGNGIFFFSASSPIEFAKALTNFISDHPNMEIVSFSGNSIDEYLRFDSTDYGWVVLVKPKH